ncbi:MAG: hypothetical protein SWH78_12875 [Thermodesulfobacteriota bacterium]|nr:hypothetical protein [Thermodesulfobacteriota bacterium]
MADLKIRIYKGKEKKPEKTITVPGGILKLASRLVPKKAAVFLEEKGIDVKEIIELSQQPDVHGTLVEVEEHKKKERIVISVE